MAGDNVLRRGAYMRRSNGVWMVRLLSKGVIHLEKPDTGEVDRIDLKQWNTECSSGVTRMVGAPDAELSETDRALRKIALSDLPGNVRISALQKDFFVSAFNDPGNFYRKHLPDLTREQRDYPNKSKAKLVPFSYLVRDAFVGEHGTRMIQTFERPGATARPRNEKQRTRVPVPAHFLRAPAFSTYCKWIAEAEGVALRNGAPDPKLNASRYHDRGPTARTMSSQVETWLNEIIDTLWLTTSRNSKIAVSNKLKKRILDHNKANPEKPLVAPSDRHVRKYIAETVEQETAVRRREGDDAADDRFKPVGEGPVARWLLDIVEVDHTPANVDVCDDATGIKLGRPTITTALDRYSRAPVGIHVHFDGPSLGAVMTVLRNVMTMKDYLRTWLPDIKADYPCYGRPQTFYFDRGTDFDNEHVREINGAFDIVCEYEPVGCPNFKGKLERFQRTAAEQVAHPLPGATPPRDKDGDFRRDAKGQAYITLGAFIRRHWRWVMTVYMHSPHRGIRTTPHLKWIEGSELRLPRPLPSKDELKILMNRIEYLVPSRRGVQWKNLRWKGDVLRAIRSHPSFKSGDRVKVRIDESNVANAWVVDPVTREQIALEPILADYMPGLSYYQHRMAMLYSDERLEGARDEESLLTAIQELDTEADELLAANGTRNKSIKAAARYAGPGGGLVTGEPSTPSAPSDVVPVVPPPPPPPPPPDAVQSAPADPDDVFVTRNNRKRAEKNAAKEKTK
jgi:putative transposase